MGGFYLVAATVTSPALFLLYRLAVLLLAWKIFDRTDDPKSLKEVSRFLGSRTPRD